MGNHDIDRSNYSTGRSPYRSRPTGNHDRNHNSSFTHVYSPARANGYSAPRTSLDGNEDSSQTTPRYEHRHSVPSAAEQEAQDVYRMEYAYNSGHSQGGQTPHGTSPYRSIPMGNHHIDRNNYAAGAHIRNDHSADHYDDGYSSGDTRAAAGERSMAPPVVYSHKTASETASSTRAPYAKTASRYSDRGGAPSFKTGASGYGQSAHSGGEFDDYPGDSGGSYDGYDDYE